MRRPRRTIRSIWTERSGDCTTPDRAAAPRTPPSTRPRPGTFSVPPATLSWPCSIRAFVPRTNGARIINASLDSPAFSQAFSNAIYAAREAGIIFVASAGNNSANIDLSPRYPSCFDIDNIISVAYTTRNDVLGGLSNFGATNVDLAAPGAVMYSCFFTADNAYLGGTFLQGTSFAAPYVA